MAAEPNALRPNRRSRSRAKCRTGVIANRVHRPRESPIGPGPFKVKDNARGAMAGTCPARLPGASEASPAAVIGPVIAREPQIISAVSAAAGLAVPLPGAPVLARDAKERAQGLSGALVAARFAAPHKATGTGRKPDHSGLPGLSEALFQLDEPVSLWDWRGGSTPWLWMEKR